MPINLPAVHIFHNARAQWQEWVESCRAATGKFGWKAAIAAGDTYGHPQWVTRSAIILAILPALAASTQSVGRPRALIVNVQHMGDGCDVTLNGVHVTFDNLLEGARREHNRPAVITFGKDLPYKCLAATIITLQEAGVMDIDTRPSLPK